MKAAPSVLDRDQQASKSPQTTQRELAAVPPLGWNSWNSYGMFITEAELLEIADVIARRLKEYGWQYVVIDAGWFNSEPKAGIQKEAPALQLDSHGRLIPCPKRFPSSADGVGLRAVAERIHAMGLRFGVHLMRGIPRQAVERNLPIAGTQLRAADIADPSRVCVWNSEMFGVDMSKPGAQEYYDSVAQLLADWGIDFVKADDMSAPYHAAEIEGLRRGLLKTGRPIVLSLSPGTKALRETFEHGRQHSEMRRISGDLWDTWLPGRTEFTGLRQQFDIAAHWQGLSGPGHWLDLDMLPIGRLSLRGEGGAPRQSGLSADEQKSMLTLWALFQSPLMLGGDPLTLTDADMALLTDRDVIAINQRAHGGREIHRGGELRAWRAELSDGRRVLGLFNLGDEQPLTVDLTRPELDVRAREQIWDVWAKRSVNVAERLEVPPHGARLLRLG